jgi:two-component system heavy metal sensor histidine kinase CusS
MSSKSAPEPATGPAPGRRPWSLAARLAAWYAGSAFLLVLSATGFLYWVLAANLDREDDELLADKVHVLRMLLRDTPEGGAPLRQEVEWESAARRHVPFYVRILDADGRTLMETPGMGAELPAAAFPGVRPGEAGPGEGAEVRSPAGRSFRVLVARAEAARPGGRPWLLQVAVDRSREEDLLAGYRAWLWLSLGLALVLCTLTGYGIARRGLRPVAEMAETARRIRSSTLDQRLAADGLPAELAALAATFNEMLDRLEESFARLARFSADIAHELRTPVNNLRGEAEVALGKPRSPEEYREALASGLEECVRLSRLIDSLLFLARAESPETQVAREPVDVGRELAALRDFYEPAAAEAGVALTVTCRGGCTAALDRTLFQRAVGNLVDNALAHTPAGGSVTLAAAAEGGAVRVEVADTGGGIPPEHLPHLFDRFYRADPARSAGGGRVGLGLAIVRSITALHGGSAAVASEVGRGTRVSLVFPRECPPAAGAAAHPLQARGDSPRTEFP